MHDQLRRIEAKLDFVIRQNWHIADTLAAAIASGGDAAAVAAVAAHVRAKTAELRAAIADAAPPTSPVSRPVPVPEGFTMPVAAIDQLVSDVTAEDTVIDSAIALITGFQQRLDAAVAAATAGGATAAQLKPLSDLSADIQARTKALSDAVAANTPAPPPAPAPTPPAPTP